MPGKRACLAVVLSLGVAVARPDTYGTCFEGFSLGPLQGQFGWSSTDPREPHIDDANPSWGNRHMRFGYENGATSRKDTTAYGPDIGPFPAWVDWGFALAKICVSDTKGSTFEFAVRTPQAGTLNAAMRFTPDGDVLVLGASPSGPAYFDAGFDWPIGEYFDVDIEMMHGVVEYTIWDVGQYAVPGCARLTAEQISFTQYDDGSYNRVFDVDCVGYGWIPEPASVLLLLAGLNVVRPSRAS